MLKKIIVAAILVGIFGILIFGAVNRSKAKISVESETDNETSHGISVVSSNNDQPKEENDSSQEREPGYTGEVVILPPASLDGLSDIEKAGLSYMREEEKLAHDVYAVFYSLYQTQNFQNISQSELTHADAVKTLIDRYGIHDPASSEPGVFTNPDLQAMYHELLSMGSQSLGDALKVGAEIEEIDILDLQKYMAETDNADIRQVYESLLTGSENHLRAFVAKLQKETGENYVPQYLSLEVFQAIIDENTQVGGGNQGSGGLNGGYRNGQP
jgi:hypothetical protein